jgi:hypothetical protein
MRLTCKFAEMIDSIDLSGVRADDELGLTEQDARLLIAEGWAVPLDGPAVAEDRKPKRRRRPSTL